METAAKIEREHIQALKEADKISVFIFFHNDQRYTEIRCQKAVKGKGIWSNEHTESTFSIFLNGGHVPEGFKKAYWHIDTPRNNGTWRAFTMLLRPGDELSFDTVTNNNSYLDQAEIPAHKLGEKATGGYEKLYNDILRVTIRRKDSIFIPRMHLESVIAIDNNARPLQP